MAKGPTYVVQYRRKREGKTDYKRRLDLLKSRKPRLVIRLSNKRVIAQIVDYMEDGDQVIASADSNDLKNFGWGFSGTNLSSAYLVGFLCGKRALQNGKKEAILDSGLQQNIKGSRLYSALKGVIDSEVKVPVGDSVYPDENRISGGHVAEYASKLEKADYEKKFSGYIKAGCDPRNMPASFEETKKKITESFK